MKTKDKLAMLTAAAAAMSGSAPPDVYTIGKPYELDRDLYDIPSVDFSGPIFTPKKHTVMSYAKQNRLAKQKRKQRGKKK
jgi:hypothetical protein